MSPDNHLQARFAMLISWVITAGIRFGMVRVLICCSGSMELGRSRGEGGQREREAWSREREG